MIFPIVNLCGVLSIVRGIVALPAPERYIISMQFSPLPEAPVIIESNCTAVEVVPVASVPVPIDDTDDLHNPDLIWSKAEFPHKTRKISYTPLQLYTTLRMYSNCVTPFTDLLDLNGVDMDSFYRLSDLYPEIREAYSRARIQRAKKFGEIAEKIYAEEPADDWLYQTDKNSGARVLTTAGATYLKNKADNAHRIAAIMETGSFIAVSKQENINRNLSLNVTVSGKLPDGFDLATADPSDIVAAIKGRRK